MCIKFQKVVDNDCNIVWVHDFNNKLSLIKVWFSLTSLELFLYILPWIQFSLIKAKTECRIWTYWQGKFPHHEARFAMKWHVWWFSTHIVTRLYPCCCSNCSHSIACITLMLPGSEVYVEYWKWQLRDYNFIFNHRHWRLMMMVRIFLYFACAWLSG